MKNYNTLFLITSDYPFGKGETFLENEMPYLAKAFEHIELISNNLTDEQTREIPENVKLHRLPYGLSTKEKLWAYRFKFHPLFWEELGVILKQYKLKLKPSIIHTIVFSLASGDRLQRFIQKLMVGKGYHPSETVVYSYWANDMATGLGLLKKSVPSVKVLCRAHRWDIYFYAHAIQYLPLRRFITRTLDRLLAISDDGYEYIKEKWQPDSMATVLISRLGTKKPLELNPVPKLRNQLNLISCSNVIPVKRVDLILKAVSLATGSIQWVHLGTGAGMDELKREVKTLNNSKKAILKGSVPNIEVLRLYQESPFHLFINVSASEGVPVSIMEALSFGIPVIATAVGGTPEIVKHKVNGYLLSPNPTVEEIVEGFQFFRDLSDEEYGQLRINARQTWEDDYDAEKNYQGFVEGIRK